MDTIQLFSSPLHASEDNYAMRFYLYQRRTQFQLAAVITCVIIIVVLIIVLAMGWHKANQCCGNLSSVVDENPSVTTKLFSRLSTKNIRDNLRRFTKFPHLAGTAGDELLADDIESIWKEQGLHVVRRRYDVLLSYPNSSDPSGVELFDLVNRTIVHRSTAAEDKLTDEQNAQDIVPPFNAYSPSADVTGDLIYANYATDEDFRTLQVNFSINCTGKIIIARYGKIYRGDKVYLATKAGAIGLILFSDPGDYGPPAGVNAFPETWWLPESGVERGTVLTFSAGDPLTPGYPSTDSAFRVSQKNNPALPRIPVHPVTGKDAYHFMRAMSGPEAPEDWQGGFGIKYHLGPGYVNPNWTVRLRVTTYNRNANITNIFAFINGTVEPDRYVLLGNHRDAWIFGGIDPTSATAVMVEITRVVSELVREGSWKPRRSIVFCSWDAEEYGLTGSYEWIEEFSKLLSARAIAYLNVDSVMTGNTSLTVGAMPTMHDVIFEAASKVSSPHDPSYTVFDDWLRTFPDYDTNGSQSGLPRIYTLGDDSDHAGFMLLSGVPCCDAYYTHNLQVDGFPLYHTVYEGFTMYDRIVDPEYKIALTVAQFWSETMLILAERTILPLNVSRYADTLLDYAIQLKTLHGRLMEQQGISFESLFRSISKFKTAAESFHQQLADVNKNNVLAVRAVNDQLMMVDRAFIDPQGLPLRPLQKHVIYAPSIYNSYAGSTFPGLSDLITKILQDGKSDSRDHQAGEDNQWNDFRRHYAAIIHCIEAATSYLLPVTDFMHQ